MDGRPEGSIRYELSNGGYLHLGNEFLRAGRHLITLRYGDADLYPGSSGPPPELGPLVLSRGTADQPLSYVKRSDARRLCGQTLDWIEALGA